MSVIWIGILLAGCAIIAVALNAWRHRVDMAELGSVSENWLSEQRSNDRYQSGR